jgi:hypothetical protein
MAGPNDLLWAEPSVGELEARWSASTSSSMVDPAAAGERRQTLASPLRGSQLPGDLTMLPGEFRGPDLGGLTVSPQDSRCRVEACSPAGKPEPFFSFSFFFFLFSFFSIIFQKLSPSYFRLILFSKFFIELFHNFCSDFSFFPKFLLTFVVLFFRKPFFFFIQNFCV